MDWFGEEIVYVCCKIVFMIVLYCVCCYCDDRYFELWIQVLDFYCCIQFVYFWYFIIYENQVVVVFFDQVNGFVFGRGKIDVVVEGF